jgi:hypothetical protein
LFELDLARSLLFRGDCDLRGILRPLIEREEAPADVGRTAGLAGGVYVAQGERRSLAKSF